MPKREFQAVGGPPLGFLRKDVILKGLCAWCVQGCETKGLMTRAGSGRNAAIEKEGVSGGRGDVMEQGSMELHVCQ